MVSTHNFKTLRIVDGKEYVELEEVEQVLKTLDSVETISDSVSKFEKAVQDLQSSFKNTDLWNTENLTIFS